MQHVLSQRGDGMNARMRGIQRDFVALLPELGPRIRRLLRRIVNRSWREELEADALGAAWAIYRSCREGTRQKVYPVWRIAWEATGTVCRERARRVDRDARRFSKRL